MSADVPPGRLPPCCADCASTSTIGRRALVGGAAATAAWALPTVLTLDRVAAASPSGCGTLTNVALGGTASLSSVTSWPNLPASGGINGSTNGAMSAARNGFHNSFRENGGWWELDLGADHHIDEIRLWNRGDCCQSRIQNVSITIDGVAVGVAPGVTARPSVVSGIGGCGRVIRLTNGYPGSQWFHLVEVQVFGCPA